MSHNIISSLHNVIIPFQPIMFHPSDEPTERCPCTTERYQQVYFDGDEIRIQVKSYPIGDDLFTSYNYGTNWNNNYYGNCHTPGAAGDLRVLGVLSANFNYQVTVTVTDYVAGELTVYLGLTIIGYISSEGQFVFDGLSDGNNVTLRGDADFEGCADIDAIYELCANFTGYIFDDSILDEPDTDNKPTNGAVVDLVDQIGMHAVSDSEWDITGMVLPDDGCIVIVLESCNVIENGTFTGGLSDWTVGTGWSASGNTALYNDAGTNVLSQAVIKSGHKYHIQLTVSTYASGTLRVRIGAVTFDITADGTYSFWMQSAITDTLFELVGINGVFRVDNVSARTIEGVTNVLKVIPVPDDPCSYKLLQWRNDEDAFGFDYADFPQFYFNLRIQAEIEFRSTYEEDVEDYTDGAGNSSLIYTQLRKIRNLATERVNGDVLDALAIMRRHDEILIDGFEYVVPKDNGFDPDYQNKAEVAAVTIRIARPDQDLFNSLC